MTLKNGTITGQTAGAQELRARLTNNLRAKLNAYLDVAERKSGGRPKAKASKSRTVGG